jgi:hypothetical protein
MSALQRIRWEAIRFNIRFRGFVRRRALTFIQLIFDESAMR